MYNLYLSERSFADKKSLDIAKRQTQDVKRKYAFEDLLLKEENYLHCLRQLLDIQKLATDELQPGGVILSQAEAKIIFGNLAYLVEIHQRFVYYFDKILKNWQNDCVTVQHVIKLKDAILREYETYTNNYSESKKLMEACETKNKRFRTLIQNPVKSLNKERPKDIFIRPIQRLCSLVLQLQEINKCTREDNPDKEALNEATQVIKDILQKINKSQEMVDKLKIVFDIHSQIKDCPPDLVTSHREFILKFSAQQEDIPLMIFLFNDILEITKIRYKSQVPLTDTKPHHRRLELCSNSNSLKRKPYKHVASIPLSMILNVIEFEVKNSKKYSEVFGFNVRDANDEGKVNMYCFHYTDGEREMREILLLIAEQLQQRDSSMSPHEFIITVPITRVNVVSVTSKTEGKNGNKFWDLLQIPKKETCKKKDLLKPDSVFALRKSLSCSDMIDPKIAL